MEKQHYRSLLMEWCSEMESLLRSLRSQHKEKIDSLLESIGLLKMKAEEERNQNEAELYELSHTLYDRLSSILVQTSLSIRSEGEERQGTIPSGMHRLPPLPYAYNSLEPFIAEEIMILHHTKHHQSYVAGLNKAELEMEKARDTNEFKLIKHWEREAAFHGSGHYLHTIFWKVMSPTGGGKPGGIVLKYLTNSFGSYEKFKKHFTEAAAAVEGVGWALLVWSPRARRLEILTAEKHQNLTQWDTIPLLVLDVWEHAYYLQYKNDRRKYIEQWWNIVNWQEVDRRLQTALVVQWPPY
ncbi:superoxide dismutase [Bacillus massilinigeriensis]|uniref:superoxide dismutase n=1 Tax=Bacillus mediterraneensis TaxID=1805474 RepID=UPI0008F8DEA1|nr:superoxide dismutase [Bacillus mediterraneensis]